MNNNNNNNNNSSNLNNNINNNVLEKTIPDPDNIKMFVGQVPKELDENDLRIIFEEFGKVHQINVLRDKFTGNSKGRNFIEIFWFKKHKRGRFLSQFSAEFLKIPVFYIV